MEYSDYNTDDDESYISKDTDSTTESGEEIEEDDTGLVEEQKSIWKHGGAIAIMMTDIEEIKSKQTLLIRGQKILTENLKKIGEDLKLLKTELHTGKKRMMKKTTCASMVKDAYQYLENISNLEGWDFTQPMDSDHNVKVSEQIKTNVKVLFTECEVNELELEEAVTRYRQSRMESWRKEEIGTMSKHKQTTRRAQRLKQKMLIRHKAMTVLQDQYADEDREQNWKVVATTECHSSEYSDEEQPGTFNVQKIQWESEKLTKLKRELDEHYRNSAGPKAKKMMHHRVRVPGKQTDPPSKVLEQLSWAVKEDDNDERIEKDS